MVDEQTNDVVVDQETTTDDTATEGTQEANSSDSETDDTSLLGKQGEPEPETVEVPEKYEFNMPEGRELDSEMVEKFTPVLKDLKISQEGAQKLAELLVEDQVAKEQA